MTYRILSIDACRDGCSWSWNNWHHVGDIDAIPSTSRGILKKMRDDGYLSEKSKGMVSIDDDGYNIVVCEKNNMRPLFAIEYGNKF